MTTEHKPHSSQQLHAYAESSKAFTHGEKTEDELLQRIWNLAGDVTGLLEQQETWKTALVECVEKRKNIEEQLEACEAERERLCTILEQRVTPEQLEQLETQRHALLAIFLDPLGSHGARACARQALGIPHIPFGTPEEMLTAYNKSNPASSHPYPHGYPDHLTADAHDWEPPPFLCDHEHPCGECPGCKASVPASRPQ